MTSIQYSKIEPRTVFFWLIIFLMVNLIIAISPERFNIQPDEAVYQNITKHWDEIGMLEAVRGDTKPITFLSIEKFLDNANISQTRTLNYILILACTLLIFRLTKRYESFLFILIPTVLNSLWLTVEIFEVLFVLIALNLEKYKGLFIGMAVIFRPYALGYSILIKKKQWIGLSIPIIFLLVVMTLTGLLWTYPDRLNRYGTDEAQLFNDLDVVALIMWFMMAYLGWQNKEMRYYGLIASIPFVLRTFAHYFLPSFTWFFVGYLLTKKKD